METAAEEKRTVRADLGLEDFAVLQRGADGSELHTDGNGECDL